MPLFSTIAHPTAPSVRKRLSRSRAAVGAAIVALALIGLTSLSEVLESRSDTGRAEFTAGTTLTHEEFVRLNTIELPVFGRSQKPHGMFSSRPCPIRRGSTPTGLRSSS